MQFPHGHAAVTSRAHFLIATGEPGRRNAAMMLKSEDLPAHTIYTWLRTMALCKNENTLHSRSLFFILNLACWNSSAGFFILNLYHIKGVMKMNKQQKHVIAFATAFALMFGIVPNVAAMHIMEGYLPAGYCVAWGVLCLPSCSRFSPSRKH